MPTQRPLHPPSKKRAQEATPSQPLAPRKRASPTPSSSSSSSESDDERAPLDPQEILRRHFEAQFEPISIAPSAAPEASSGSGDEDEEWNGFSDDDDADEPSAAGPMIVDFSHPTSAMLQEDEPLSKRAKRSFMSSKPPTYKSPPPRSRSASPAEDAKLEKENLENDLALQRLLRESHLLNHSSASAANFEATGKLRLRAIESRVLELGGKERKIKMPKKMRMGLDASRARKAERRRADAKEAGIVLAVEKKERKKVVRERGVGAPAVGKFSRGMLTLSRKDIGDIVGSGGKKGKAGKRRK